VLERFGFQRAQGSVYVTDSEDMANLFQAIMALKMLPWFPASVRDIRAFRIEQWSDFTPVMKKP
jgi:virulence-associated protein VapD